MSGLLAHFATLAITLDSAQQDALIALQRLMDELIRFKRKRGNAMQKWLSQFSGLAPPQGVYLYGQVGRGKTLIMEAFYAQLPYRRKRRVHFHALMQELDTAFRAQPHGTDPLETIVRAMASKTRVMCLDEITITTISDAMMFARFLHFAVEAGIVLVATSNAMPDDLYRDGLQRDRFLPAIALLKEHMQVIGIHSPTDYRLQKIAGQALWRVLTDADFSWLGEFFTSLVNKPAITKTLAVLGRTIRVLGAEDSTLMVEFNAICGVGRTVDDYQELVQCYHTLLIANLPHFSAANRDSAKRFIWLIDVAYDARVVLAASAHSPITALFADDINLFESERTVSRLLEMQSASYQAVGYRPANISGESPITPSIAISHQE